MCELVKVCMTAMLVVGKVFYVNKAFTHEFSLVFS